MALDERIRSQICLPAICAPMFLVTGAALVREACKAGIIGGLPRHNARSVEEFESWLKEIRAATEEQRRLFPNRKVGPIAVNLSTRLGPTELGENLDLCRRYGVEIIISAAGNPTELTARVHDCGGKVFHDVTSMRFAERAIRAGVDGLTCIGAGGGGHSGTISHLALIPNVRRIFDGTVILAGAVSNGATIRAAEILGADLAYLGTRFIATQESAVDEDYKRMLVEGTSADLLYTGDIAGVPANWMKASMRRVGLDPDHLPTPVEGRMPQDHLPDGIKPWVNLWSAGQGIDLIQDLPTVAELVRRLRAEYLAACALPSMAEVARLVDEASQQTA